MGIPKRHFLFFKEQNLKLYQFVTLVQLFSNKFQILTSDKDKNQNIYRKNNIKKFTF